jgi:hypothetical protein
MVKNKSVPFLLLKMEKINDPIIIADLRTGHPKEIKDRNVRR